VAHVSKLFVLVLQMIHFFLQASIFIQRLLQSCLHNALQLNLWVI
jgi:hypothetical protein